MMSSSHPPGWWSDPRRLKVLGMGTALPGPSVASADLLGRVEDLFGVAISRRGTAFAERLQIESRHLCRDLKARHEAPRPGNSNPDLASTALHAAFDEAGLSANDFSYRIGHTTTPARLVPPNVFLVADLLA